MSQSAWEHPWLLLRKEHPRSIILGFPVVVGARYIVPSVCSGNFMSPSLLWSAAARRRFALPPPVIPTFLSQFFGRARRNLSRPCRESCRKARQLTLAKMKQQNPGLADYIQQTRLRWSERLILCRNNFEHTIAKLLKMKIQVHGSIVTATEIGRPTGNCVYQPRC